MVRDMWTIGFMRLVEYDGQLWLINLGLPLYHSQHALFVMDL